MYDVSLLDDLRPGDVLTVERWNAAVGLLRLLARAPDEMLAGGIEALMKSRHSGDEYWFDAVTSETIERYSVFGLVDEVNGSGGSGNALIERVAVTPIDTELPFSPLVLLTNGPKKITRTGKVRAIDYRTPLRLRVGTGEHLSDFRVGHPCGPRSNSQGVHPHQPGFVVLGRVPKNSSEDRHDDSVWCVRTRDDSFMGRMTEAADPVDDAGGSDGEVTPGRGTAKVLWGKHGSGSGGIDKLTTSFDPDGGSGGNADLSFEIKVLNFTTDPLEEDDLVGIVPVICVGFVATPFCKGSGSGS